MLKILTAGPLALAILAGMAITSGPALAQKYVCMTNDGGRLRPCSAAFMAANPNWRGSPNCYTDDGYGAYRPCSDKAKRQK